jgi:hypothetical protein
MFSENRKRKFTFTKAGDARTFCSLLDAAKFEYKTERAHLHGSACRGGKTVFRVFVKLRNSE